MSAKRISIVFIGLIVISLVVAESGSAMLSAQPVETAFSENILGGGSLDYQARINKRDFSPGDTIEINIALNIESKACRAVIEKLNGIYLLVRAERIFDADGHYHQFTNSYASTVLTASGLPIENYDLFCDYHDKNRLIEYKGRLDPEHRFFGYSNRTPFDKYVFVKKKDLIFTDTGVAAKFRIKGRITKNFLPGYYRFQVLCLAKLGRNYRRINALPDFGSIQVKYSDWDAAILSRNVSYLPVIKVGNPAAPKMIWMLFTGEYSNATQGVVAEEDKDYFQFASRHTCPAKFILPPLQERGDKSDYIIEPDFPTMFAKNVIELEQGSKWAFQTPIPLNYNSGELFVSVENPDGTTLELGKAGFSAASSSGATTATDRFKYSFSQYGKYRVRMSGWIEDIWGTRYHGGGTYEVWIAHRLSLGAAVIPATPFEVNDSYCPDLLIQPPCAADVREEITLFRNSNKTDIKRVIIEGQANRFGFFAAREKTQEMIFDAPGEYLAEITATYTDKHGRLWMASQRCGSVVAPRDSGLEVHGSKPFLHRMSHLPERVNMEYEGQFLAARSTNSAKNTPQFVNYSSGAIIAFPYFSGDILHIANSFSGDNGFFPILTIKSKDPLLPKKENGLFYPFSVTANNFQPQGYPEFLEKQCYGYMSAFGSGFSARYMISEDTRKIWDSYWQSGGNFSGRQINSSYNGSLPGDICVLFGGIVYRDLKSGLNRYGIYSSAAVIIPQGSFANRISAPLTEPLGEINGREYYLMDTGTPHAGTVLEPGDILRPQSMVLPPIPGVSCRKKITCPGGKEYLFQGVTNKIGIAELASEEGTAIALSEPGVYRVEASCEYKGRQGHTPGSRDKTYFIYVADNKDREEYFSLDLPETFSVHRDQPVTITGRLKEPLKNALVHYSLVIAGTILDEGTLAVIDNRFTYKFSPADTAVQFPNYDTSAYEDPNIERMADTVAFTFFLQGETESSKRINSCRCFIIRADKGIVLDE